ncbi:hypothetical protein ACT29H_00265 [Thermophagus sp. OGC60D27]|uniref:hypothetical protein n=1 Tax=Thermophagus sp. OGC60D27 TaxID=3458415 RepID=UPI004037EAD2
MKEGLINLMDLSFEYKMWKNHIEWFLRDFKIILERNNEIVRSRGETELNVVEVMIVEDYEKQLKRLLKKIKTQEQEMQYYNKDFPVGLEHQYVIEHLGLRCQMEKISREVIDKISDLMNELCI